MILRLRLIVVGGVQPQARDPVQPASRPLQPEPEIAVAQVRFQELVREAGERLEDILAYQATLGCAGRDGLRSFTVQPVAAVAAEAVAGNAIVPVIGVGAAGETDRVILEAASGSPPPRPFRSR